MNNQQRSVYLVPCPEPILETGKRCEALLVKGEFDNAILCAQALLDVIEAQGLVCDPPDILYNHYRDQRDMATPTIYMNYIHRLLNYAQGHNLKVTLCYATYYKAYVYYMTRQNEDARQWFERAYVLAQELGDHRLHAMCLHNLGNICYLNGDLEQAKDYNLRGVHITDTYHIEDLRYSRHNLGLIALRKYEFDQALVYMEEALEYATLISDRNLQANSYSDIAEVYLAKGDFEYALRLFERALSFEDAYITPINLRDTYLGIAKTHEAMGNYQRAYHYLKHYNELYTQFAEKQEKDSLARLEQAYILQHWESERQLNEELTASIADLQATQAQLIQTEKRVALNRMLSGIAHNMNTPLGNAISTLSYLKEEFDNVLVMSATEVDVRELNAHQARYTEGMALVAASLDRMQAFLTLIGESAISAASLKASSIDLVSFIREVEQVYFEGGVIALTIKGETVSLRTFPGILERVLLALISNVIKHSGLPRPVAITIEIQVSKAQGHEADEVMIGVIDCGRGIAEDLIEGVFDPFVTVNMGKYSGLGLFVAKQYATEILGGNLSVTSVYGQGTSFTLSLKLV